MPTPQPIEKVQQELLIFGVNKIIMENLLMESFSFSIFRFTRICQKAFSP